MRISSVASSRLWSRSPAWRRSIAPDSKGPKNEFRERGNRRSREASNDEVRDEKTAISSTSRRCIAYASDWSVSAPASSIKFVPSSWSAASRSDKVCDSCALSCRAFSLRHPMCCLLAWCVSTEGLAEDWRRLDKRVDHLSGEIKLWRGRMSVRTADEVPGTERHLEC